MQALSGEFSCPTGRTKSDRLTDIRTLPHPCFPATPDLTENPPDLTQMPLVQAVFAGIWISSPGISSSSAQIISPPAHRLTLFARRRTPSVRRRTPKLRRRAAIARKCQANPATFRPDPRIVQANVDVYRERISSPSDSDENGREPLRLFLLLPNRICAEQIGARNGDGERASCRPRTQRMSIGDQCGIADVGQRKHHEDGQ